MIVTQSGTEARATRRRANPDGAPFYHITFVGQNQIIDLLTRGLPRRAAA